MIPFRGVSRLIFQANTFLGTLGYWNLVLNVLIVFSLQSLLHNILKKILLGLRLAICFLVLCTLWQDDDPYVRKTAAICVAKLYDINAELVEDRGFLESLKDLISDNNPMVVANAVAALAEIQENSNRPIFEITSHTLSKLLTALNECTEYVYCQ